MLLTCAPLLALPACANRVPERHPDLAPLLRDYRAMPPHRALALAGELRHGRWVAGAAGGLASEQEAIAEALEECRRRRAERRFMDPCHVYAVGDRVVWSGKASPGP